jgi:uncharacterized protein involved in outer membrane biogenesis
MRPARIAALTFTVLAAALVALALLGYLLAQSDWAARNLAQRVAVLLAAPVQLEGLSIGYFPRPHVQLRGLTVGSPADAAALLQVERARLGASWRRLRQAPASLAQLHLEGVIMRPRVDGAGSDNWTRLLDRVAELAGDEPAAFSIGELRLERGRIEYLDERVGAALTLSGLQLIASDLVPGRQFPLELRFAGEGAGQVFHAALEALATLDPDRQHYLLEKGSLHGWVGGGRLATGGVDLAGSFLRAEADLAAARASVTRLGFEGLGIVGTANLAAAGLDSSPKLSFDLVTETFAPRAVGNALRLDLPATTDPAALASARLTAQGVFDAQALELEAFSGEFDDSAFTGSLRLPVSAGTPVLRLAIDALVLDRYLPPAATDARPLTPAAALEQVLAGLAGLDLDAEIRIERVALDDAVVRELRVVVEPDAAPAAASTP